MTKQELDAKIKKATDRLVADMVRMHKEALENEIELWLGGLKKILTTLKKEKK